METIPRASQRTRGYLVPHAFPLAFTPGLLRSGRGLWAVGLCGIAAYANRRGAVTRANFQRVDTSMTEEEVGALLGEPGIRYEIRNVDAGEYSRIWLGRESVIILNFAEELDPLEESHVHFATSA